jgi:hypothetical protein
MKRLIPFVLGAAVLTSIVSFNARAETLLPGQVDFGTFTASTTGGEFVEINVPGNLISLAARLVRKQEPEVAQLLNGLQLVRVNVIGLDDGNRAEVSDRAQTVRKEMETKGWQRLVTAQQKGQDVSVFLKMQGKDTVQGLTVVVIEGKKQAVFVNVVGDIKPEKLALLGDRLHIDPLKNLSLPTEKKEKSEKSEKSEKAED